MAVIQISKIQVRRGLQENLPSLAPGELGWSTDTRRLYIGNGLTTAPDYSPESGITEVLTEFSQAYILGGITSNVAILQANVAALEANVSAISSTLGTTTETLVDGALTATNTSIGISSTSSISIDYTLVRGSLSRVGTIKATQVGGTGVIDDEYNESGSTGVTFNVTGFGTNALLTYTSTATGTAATFTYYIKTFA